MPYQSQPLSGDQLHALPVAACDTRLNDEAIRVAVGLRLGLIYVNPTQARVAHQWMPVALMVCRASIVHVDRHDTIS